MKDLSLCSTEDLITEIENRCDCVVVAYNQIIKNDERATDVTQYKGDLLKCLGLCDIVKHSILKGYLAPDNQWAGED